MCASEIVVSNIRKLLQNLLYRYNKEYLQTDTLVKNVITFIYSS